MSLVELGLGKEAKIIEIDHSVQGIERRRLMDLGFIPNETVKPVLHGLFNDPIGYLIKNAVIALRNDQARMIKIKMT